MGLAAVSPSAAAVTVSYVAAGAVRRGNLDELWSVPFEHACPARAFGSFKGKRSFQGSWWFATTGEHVGFESWLERDNLMLLDFDPQVIAVSSQPFWLSWTDGRTLRRHCPDYFARLADGTAVVIDVRAAERTGPDAEVFAATGRACERVGWKYRRAGVVDLVLLANVRWLAGYRHQRCLNAVHAAAMQDALATPRALGEAVRAVGDRIAVLPTVFHLMWSGAIRADLHRAPMSTATTLTWKTRAR